MFVQQPGKGKARNASSRYKLFTAIATSEIILRQQTKHS